MKLKPERKTITTDLIVLFTVFSVILVTVEFSVYFLNIPEYIFPSPSSITSAILNQKDSIYSSWIVTSGEALGGLLIAIFFSTFLAFITLFSKPSVTFLIGSFGTFLQSVPLLAIAPLLSLWFGNGYLSKIMAVSLICFFPLLNGWLRGFNSVGIDPKHLFENMGASQTDMAFHLMLPLSVPYFLAGLRVAVPLSLLGAIVAEFVGSSEGVGFQILNHSYYLRVPEMFAYIIVAAFTGILLTYLVDIIESRLLKWYGGNNSTP